MQLLTMQLILVLAILILHSAIRTVAGIDLALTLPSKFCVMERVKRMLAYNCHDLRLKEVPQYMKSSVEVRDCTGDFFISILQFEYINLDQLSARGQLASRRLVGLDGAASLSR